MKAKRKAKFKVGQVVCLKGYSMPDGAGVITGKDGIQWKVKVMSGNSEIEWPYPESALRPLTAKERGK